MILYPRGKVFAEMSPRQAAGKAPGAWQGRGGAGRGSAPGGAGGGLPRCKIGHSLDTLEATLWARQFEESEDMALNPSLSTYYLCSWTVCLTFLKLNFLLC